jgi:chemotaxis protein CheY-P-specific phosphatase CheC
MRRSEELSEQDAVDGVSEVMNIIAGKVKSAMSNRDHSLRLGMPIFMQQPIQVREGMERVQADVMIGPVPCTLMVFKMKQAA